MSNNREELNQKIIIPAWNIIKNDSKLKKFYVIPWILSVIFLSWILVYQTLYTYIKIFWNSEKYLDVILKYFENSNHLWIIIAIIVFIILYFILTPIFEWGLIKYIELKEKGKEISKSEAFWQWVYKFLPMFEYNNFFSEFKILSIINFYLFTIRFVGLEYIKFVNYVYIFIFIVWIVINVLFVYAKYYIVIEKKTIFKSIGDSTRLAILNLKQTIKLYFIMFVLNLRVLLNFIAFLFFPIFIAVSISLITSKFLLILALSIISLIFVSLILFLWYLTAVLDIFKTALWYYAYIDGKNNLDGEDDE